METGNNNLNSDAKAYFIQQGQSINKLNDIELTLCEFLASTGYGIIPIRLIVRTSKIEVSIVCCYFSLFSFIDSKFDTKIVSCDKAKIFCFHREKKFLESISKIMSGIFIYRSSIEIDEQVSKLHSFHPIDGNLRRWVIEEISECHKETVIKVSSGIFIYEVGHKCSDTVYPFRVLIFLCRIEYIFVDRLSDFLYIFFQRWYVGIPILGEKHMEAIDRNFIYIG